MSKRERVSFNAATYERNIKELEAKAEQIRETRSAAAAIIGKAPESLLGEEEVKEYLTLPDYPQAPQHTAAELLGIIEELRTYRKDLQAVSEPEAFTVKGGKVVIKEEVIKELEEANSLYFEGERLEVFKQLRKVCNELNKINSPKLRQMIKFRHTGEAVPDIMNLQMVTR